MSACFIDMCADMVWSMLTEFGEKLVLKLVLFMNESWVGVWDGVGRWFWNGW
jgi:hypothetical protein